MASTRWPRVAEQMRATRLGKCMALRAGAVSRSLPRARTGACRGNRTQLPLAIVVSVRSEPVRKLIMPRGDKSKYTDKQERKADHIAEGYEKRGVSEKEAERRAWATVNKDDKGARKKVAQEGAAILVTLRPTRAAKRVAPPPRVVQRQVVPYRPRRLLRPASATQTITPRKRRPADSSILRAALPVCRVALGIMWPVTSLHRLLRRGAEFRSIFCHSSPGGSGVQKDFAVELAMHAPASRMHSSARFRYSCLVDIKCPPPLSGERRSPI